MTMAARGYAKLIEELGELSQILGKRLAYYTTNEHPDGGPALNLRIEDEIGDVLAACDLVIMLNSDLSPTRIEERKSYKFIRFMQWENQKDNNEHSIDAREKRLREAFLMCRQLLANHTGTWSNAATFGLQPEDIGVKREEE